MKPKAYLKSLHIFRKKNLKLIKWSTERMKISKNFIGFLLDQSFSKKLTWEFSWRIVRANLVACSFEISKTIDWFTKKFYNRERINFWVFWSKVKKKLLIYLQLKLSPKLLSTQYRSVIWKSVGKTILILKKFTKTWTHPTFNYSKKCLRKSNTGKMWNP